MNTVLAGNPPVPSILSRTAIAVGGENRAEFAAASASAKNDRMSVPVNAMVSFEAVSKRFPANRSSAEVVALDGIDLDVPRGSILGIIGRSGAGKSTLIRLVNGLEKPTSGQRHRRRRRYRGLPGERACAMRAARSA